MSRTRCADPTCGREFSTAYAAKYHYERCHEGREPPRTKCKQCGKSYPGPLLARHVREAHSENRFECKACGCFFPVRQSLDRHERHVHKGVRHPCPYCEKQVLHLAGHLRAGHGMGPREAKQMEEELTGKSAARTDLQWTAFSSHREHEDVVQVAEERDVIQEN